MGEQQDKVYNKKCIKCREDFVWFNDEAVWDYKGYTPTKLIKCPHCLTVQAVDYEVEQNVNYDPRYYE